MLDSACDSGCFLAAAIDWIDFKQREWRILAIVKNGFGVNWASRVWVQAEKSNRVHSFNASFTTFSTSASHSYLVIDCRFTKDLLCDCCYEGLPTYRSTYPPCYLDVTMYWGINVVWINYGFQNKPLNKAFDLDLMEFVDCVCVWVKGKWIVQCFAPVLLE